ncbi:MAG: helix-turn-helix domain-containing protein [Chloroflexi bacterium]|nr:helix-turn-helix domain-containing protein [Chloroflexota bacterium]
MPTEKSLTDPQSFLTFGALLRYLRHRARLTQHALSIAVGYSTGHINRFEKNKRVPDPAAVAALFIPALDLDREPVLAARLIELATNAHKSPDEKEAAPFDSTIALEPIPPAAPNEIPRTSMLERVRARLDQAQRVALCGLPGVGKTTLASDIARQIARDQNMSVFWLTLTEDVTTSVDAVVRQLAAFLIAQGQTQVKPLIATDTRTKISLDQQIALMGSALGAQPALLCFDNAELIQRDPALLQVIQHLSCTSPAFMLLTTRESLPLANIVEIDVQGLTYDEGMMFIDSNLQLALDEKQAQRLIEKTGANPMLLQLALGQLFDQRIDAETFIARLESQPQVAAYLLRTIQKQLSSGAWRLLLLLAVAQQPLNLYDVHWTELVQAQASIENMSEAIVELQRRHLIDDAVHARLHPLVRDYVYLTLNAHPSLRRRLQRLTADWLADKDIIAAAMHYNCAGLADQALDLIEENERGIVERGLALSAVTILDEAHIQIKRQHTDQTDVLRRLLALRGMLLKGTLRMVEGEANLREALALTTNPSVRAHLICQLGKFTNSRSQFEETLQLVRAARAELAPSDLILHAELYLLESGSYVSLGKLEENRRAANQALALTEQMVGLNRSLISEIRARAEYDLATHARIRRDLNAAMHHAEIALASARDSRQPRLINLCLAYVGGLFFDLGDLDTSFRYRSEALGGLLAIGDMHMAAYMLTHLADIHHLRLEDEQALENLAQANVTLRIVNDMRGLAAAASLRTSCWLWCGKIKAARGEIEQLLKDAANKGTEQMWGYRLNKLAMVQLVQGETDVAIATLRKTCDLPTVKSKRMMRFDLYSTLAFALAVAGEPSEAARTLAAAPFIEGLSRWVEFERALIEGYIALARGDTQIACAKATEVAQRAENYPLYRVTAHQLLEAIQSDKPVSSFPQMLWVASH